MNTTTETVQHTPTLISDGSTGDGKRAFYVAKENDGWHDLRIEVDTDDCDGEFAVAAMERVVRACNNHEALVKALKPFAALINWADISESDADDEAFLTGTRNDIESFCGAKTAVLTVGDLRRAKAALATATQ